MFIRRDLAESIILGSRQMPVLAIIGPRQSGKSTLAKELFKDHVYLDMQDAALFEFANNDPKGFLNTYKNEYGLIIDEAQYAPPLFSQIKVEADKNPQKGYYILSGSQNFLMHEKISESLAGRVYFYRLLPLSINELKHSKLLLEKPAEQILKGFYPRLYQPNINPERYYENYIATYVERDIRTIRNVENILTFQKFMQLCAMRVGSILNLTNLATNCGISVNTARSWLSLLETSFILFLLPSYHSNLGKRVTKSPKLYFYDVGLASNLMKIDINSLYIKREIYGALFENMIIVDIMKNLNSQESKYNLSFYRDSNQNEIDLIIETKGKIIPLEIKAAEVVQSSYFDTLRWFKNEINSEQPVLVYEGSQNQIRSIGKVISWDNTFKIIN